MKRQAKLAVDKASKSCGFMKQISVLEDKVLVLVFWILGYPGPPAPGPLQWPSFSPGVERRPKPSGEDPHEEAPHEENDG
jgi:hypothetical protein